MQNPLIFISLALATGVAIGVVIQYDFDRLDTPAPKSNPNTAILATDQKVEKNPDTDHPTAGLTELNQLLQNEIRERKVLEQEIETLRLLVAEIGTDFEPSERTTSSEQVDDGSELDESDSNRGWFNEQALIDSGIDSGQANELKIYFEQLEMERLYLRDQSIREKWSSEKLREAMQALESKEDELKNQLSETAYDAYLYAAGRPNRVAVTSVLENAQAGLTGIKSGDHIIRYDNQRIYNWLDLREATASGNISDMVELQIERDDKMIQFYLTRGPLGIRMNSVSVAPWI